MKFTFKDQEYDLPELESKGRYWNKILRVTSGCTPCSPGCDNCHEAAREHRFYPHSGATDHEDGQAKYTGKVFIEPIAGVEKKCLIKKPTVYFVWNDLFHPHVSDDHILAVMLAMSQSRRNNGPHIYLLCTKRVGRMAELLNKWCSDWLTFHEGCTGRIPYHIWPMATFCNQAEFDAGIGDLLSIKAAVRMLNLEPLLGLIVMPKYIRLPHPVVSDIPIPPRISASPGIYKVHLNPHGARSIEVDGTMLGIKPDECEDLGHDINWVITGGETGPGARPAHPAWFRILRDQCKGTGTPFLFKQWGEYAETGPLSKSIKVICAKCGFRCDENDIDALTKHYNDCGYVGPHSPQALYRVGRKAAGRLIDGEGWDQLPGVCDDL